MKPNKSDESVEYISQNVSGMDDIGEYLLVEAQLPCADIQNIGILLLAPKAGRLYCRFRRDFKEFAGDEADWFKEQPAHILQMADELGAQACLEGLESSLSNTLRISNRRSVFIKNGAARTLDVLYSKHVRPNVLRYLTHLPQYSLEAAAGKFGRKMNVAPEGWVEVLADLPLTEDMFVIHVEGHSMEPIIPDGSLCAFRSISNNSWHGSWHGKILLLEDYSESGGSRHTVKLCLLSKTEDPSEQHDIAWLHHRVTLESMNPAYKSWDVASAEKIRPLGEFLFVV